MKKIKRILLAFILIIPFAFLLSACGLQPHIVGFEKTSSVGTTDTYLITYSNGETKSFSVENGKNGKDGQSLTVEEIKKYCEEKNITIEQFFETYLELEINVNPIKTATNKAMQSAISLFTEATSLFGKAAYAGSGVIYQMDEDYTYIITNYHVTHNGNSISSDLATKIMAYQYGENELIGKDSTGVYVYDDSAIECEYVGGSDRYDLAVIRASTAKIKANNPNARPIKIANSYSIADTVIAIGNPSGDGLSVTQGIISVISEKIDMQYDNSNYYKSIRVMRIDAAVNGGNSGGGLYNINGELVGIVNAKISSTDIENIAYALPVGNSINVAESIIYNYKTYQSHYPTQAKFNIYYTEDNFRSVYDEEDDTITLYNDILIAEEPVENGLGDRIGFNKNDIVLSATVKRGTKENTYTFNRSHELTDLCLILREGDSLTFKVKRNNEIITIGNDGTIVTSADLIRCDTTADYIKTKS
jgi:S1-C subfamily serine protease